MSRREQSRAVRGSQKWLQVLVNQRPLLINRFLAGSLGLVQEESIHWLSPLEVDEYAEYRDQEFIARLGITLETTPLSSFWPRGGPAWDGLAKTDRGDLILVEAKAHIPEMLTAATRASGSALTKIQKSLAATKRCVGSHSKVDWATHFYQHANRLAHLYLLRELNALPAYLLCVCFINDREMNGPGSRLEWEGAIKLLESFLGIPEEHRLAEYVLHAFVDVRELESTVP